jgi:hypothetical protein
VPRAAVAYADLDTSGLCLEAKGGYVFCSDVMATDAVRTLVLAPRVGRAAHGVLVYTNWVLHSGADDEAGPFVAGFERDDPIT